MSLLTDAARTARIASGKTRLALLLDNPGYIYVTDSLPARIQKFDVAGTFVTKWGGPADGLLNRPYGIAVDSYGYVYVSYTYDDEIGKYDSSGILLHTWGFRGRLPQELARGSPLRACLLRPAAPSRREPPAAPSLELLHESVGPQRQAARNMLLEPLRRAAQRPARAQRIRRDRY